MLTIEEQRAIQAIVTSRDIPHLVHFTHVNNLSSILQYGFYPQSRKNDLAHGIAQINDQLRLDNKLEYSCFSITFPNSKMFYRVRNKIGGDWAVLLINKKILWEKECLFYPTNAANNSVRFNNVNDHKGHKALNDIFTSSDESPRDVFLSACDPTDEQAEVMISGIIEPSYIDAIIFDNQLVANHYYGLIKNKEVFYCRPATKIYTTRKAFRYGH